MLYCFEKEGKKTNPLKYIESMKDKDCNNALLKLIHKINLKAMKNIINETPEYYKNNSICQNIVKEFYNQVLLPVYNHLM